MNGKMVAYFVGTPVIKLAEHSYLYIFSSNAYPDAALVATFTRLKQEVRAYFNNLNSKKGCHLIN